MMNRNSNSSRNSQMHETNKNNSLIMNNRNNHRYNIYSPKQWLPIARRVLSLYLLPPSIEFIASDFHPFCYGNKTRVRQKCNCGRDN